jgi:polysaccharide export outer membrane protein
MKLSVFYTALVLVFTQFIASAVSAQQSYRIRAGDTLRIEVIEDATLNRSALVSPDGRISVPLAGHIRAAGRSIEAIQADLTAQLAANFQSTPNVFVAVERLAVRRAATPRAPEPDPTMEIFVLGEVGSPGKMTVAPDSTVLQVFAQMGGFTRFAATGRVQLRRTNDSGVEDVYELDYDAIEAGMSNDGMVKLSPGDVIVVPQRWLFE